MKRCGWLASAVFFAVLWSTGFAAKSPAPTPAPPPPAPSVAVESVERGTIVHGRVPGRLVSYAFARSREGTRVVLLSDPAPEKEEKDEDKNEDEKDAAQAKADAPAPVPMPPCPNAKTRAPLVLHAFDATKPTTIVRLAEAPAEAFDVDVFDLDGDGTDEIVVTAPGKVLRLEESGTLSVLFEDDAIVAGAPHSLSSHGQPARPYLPLLSWGVLELAGARDDGTWGVLARADVPLRGAVQVRELRAHTLVPQLLGTTADGTLIFGTQPDQVDDLRLHVQLFRLSRNGAVSTEDCWARLPEPEKLTGWTFLLVDDRPVLVALTSPAGELSFFADRGLRVYPLETDRSRLGRPALLSTKTAATITQNAKPVLHDVDGDGDLDLVLAYVKGLFGTEIALEVYLRGEELKFDSQRVTTAFDVKDADRSFLEFGRDVDGDAIGDLVLRSESDYLIYPGRHASSGKKLVASEPVTVAAPGEADMVQELVVSEGMFAMVRSSKVGSAVTDIDGDGIAELVSIERGGADTPAVLHFVKLARPGGKR